MMKRTKPAPPPDVKVEDEPGWEDRFKRGLERAVNTPAKRGKQPPKSKKLPVPQEPNT